MPYAFRFLLHGTVHRRSSSRILTTADAGPCGLLTGSLVGFRDCDAHPAPPIQGYLLAGVYPCGPRAFSETESCA